MHGFRWGGAALTVAFILACEFGANMELRQDLDMTAARQFVTRAATSLLGVPPARITCPRSVPSAVGSFFECTVRTEGGSELTAHVKQTDARGKLFAWIEDPRASEALADVREALLVALNDGDTATLLARSFAAVREPETWSTLEETLACRRDLLGEARAARTLGALIPGDGSRGGKLVLLLEFSGGEQIEVTLSALREAGEWRLAGLSFPRPGPADPPPEKRLKARGDEFFASWNATDPGEIAEITPEQFVRATYGRVLSYEAEGVAWTGEEVARITYRVVLEKAAGTMELGYRDCGRRWPLVDYSTSLTLN